MLNDLWQLVVQFASFLWPFHTVNEWERALYLFNGRVVTPWRWVGFSLKPQVGRELKPGLYLVFPYFAKVHSVAVSWNYVDTKRLDLTLKDGRTLTCEAVAKVRVVDLYAAYVGYYDYDIDIVAAFRAAVSETLVSAEADRFEPDKRGRLLGTSLLRAIREVGTGMGHEVESVQVTTFVLQPKVIRLLQ